MGCGCGECALEVWKLYPTSPLSNTGTLCHRPTAVGGIVRRQVGAAVGTLNMGTWAGTGETLALFIASEAFSTYPDHGYTSGAHMRSHGVRIRSVSTLSMHVGLQQATNWVALRFIYHVHKFISVGMSREPKITVWVHSTPEIWYAHIGRFSPPKAQAYFLCNRDKRTRRRVIACARVAHHREYLKGASRTPNTVV